MGRLSEVNDFMKFARKDAWGSIKKDPERAFLGAIDPFSSWMWGGITGKDYEPIINVFGSPAGGGGLGMDKSGGQYGRAQEQGIDTNSAEKFFTTGDAIAGIFGGGSLLDASGLSTAGSGMSEAFSGGSAMGAGETGASGGLLGGSEVGAGLTTGAGLLQPQEQPQQQPAAQMQAPDPQAQQRAAMKMQQAMMIQQLRQKPNKTLEEWAMLQRMTENQGLLGG